MCGNRRTYDCTTIAADFRRWKRSVYRALWRNDDMVVAAHSIQCRYFLLCAAAQCCAMSFTVSGKRSIGRLEGGGRG